MDTPTTATPLQDLRIGVRLGPRRDCLIHDEYDITLTDTDGRELFGGRRAGVVIHGRDGTVEVLPGDANPADRT